MTELLVELVKRAGLEQAVAIATLENGLTLMAYPLKDEMLIGLGLEGRMSNHVDGQLLLEKRGRDMPRYGAWLPAQFRDGSWYVTRRVRVVDPELPVLGEDALEAGEELLA